MKMLRGFIGMMLLAVLAAAIFPTAPTTSYAQGGPNLILNPDFDQGATPRAGYNGKVPTNWEIWTAGNVNIFSDTDGYFSHVRSPQHSWLMLRDLAEWTGGGFQVVAVEANKNYTFTIHSYIWTCNDTQWSCIRGDGSAYSMSDSGAVVKVGLDPTGGRDPNSASIIWSPTISPHPDHPGGNQRIPFTPLSVTAKATGTTMTAWLYFSSPKAMRWVEVHWDDASMVWTDAPATGAPGAAAATAAPPTPQFVPFVTAQQPRPDGSLVHVVVAQDTISSILFAYKDFNITREDLIKYNGWRFEPQFITIGQEIVILPPGSLDPATGQLIAGGAAAVAPEAGTPAPTTAAAAPTATGAAPAASTPAPASTEEPGTSPDTANAQPTEAAPGVVIASGVTPGAPVNSNRAAMEVINNFLPSGSISH